MDIRRGHVVSLEMGTSHEDRMKCKIKEFGKSQWGIAIGVIEGWTVRASGACVSEVWSAC